jgi:hypothetical protein
MKIMGLLSLTDISTDKITVKAHGMRKPLKFGKTKTWGNASNTRISGAFIGKYDIDKDAIFQPLFSNLFLGEIMRLDAPDFPLWQAAIKHRFAGKLKIHLAIKAVSQINDPLTNEQNLEFGIIPFKNHLKVTLEIPLSIRFLFYRLSWSAFLPL